MRTFLVVAFLLGGQLWGQAAKPIPRAEDQQVVVATDASRVELTAPDPSQKVMVREELLDGNPGRGQVLASSCQLLAAREGNDAEFRGVRRTCEARGALPTSDDEAI